MAVQTEFTVSTGAQLSPLVETTNRTFLEGNRRLRRILATVLFLLPLAYAGNGLWCSSRS